MLEKFYGDLIELLALLNETLEGLEKDFETYIMRGYLLIFIDISIRSCKCYLRISRHLAIH